MKDNKILLTTYIYGEKYQNFIPILLFTIAKAYPEYHTMLFVYGKIHHNLDSIIEKIRETYNNFTIIENVFDDCPNHDTSKSPIAPLDSLER